MHRLLAQHAVVVLARTELLHGKSTGGAPRQRSGQPQAEGRCSACPGPFSARAALISGPTGAALHVASTRGARGGQGRRAGACLLGVFVGKSQNLVCR